MRTNPTPENCAGVTREILGLMGKNRVTQGEVANVLGLSRPQASQRFHDRVVWRLDELFKIAQFFDVPITDLFPDQGIRSSGGNIDTAFAA